MPNVSNVMWEVKHCSVSQFPHQEKWKQFVLLSHLNPGSSQNGDGLKLQRRTALKQGRYPLHIISAISHEKRRAKTLGQVLNPLPPASRAVIKPIHTGQVWPVPPAAPALPGLGSHQLLSATLDMAQGLCQGGCGSAGPLWWHRGFPEGQLGSGSASLAEVFDPIVAVAAEAEESKLSCQFVPAELLQDSD